MTDQLIRRDVPLEQGRRLLFTFTVSYPVTINEDLTADDAVTYSDIEYWLGKTDEQILKEVAENYDREMVELVVTLDDADSPARFETSWERESRLRGEAWTSRQWVDVPPARPTLRPGQCITEVVRERNPADSPERIFYCERVRGHAGTHTTNRDEAERLDREAASSAGASA